MTTADTFSTTWDLARIFPHPESPEFETVFQNYHTRLKAVVASTSQLPPVSTDPAAVTAWRDFMADWSAIRSLATDLDAFIGCHAAADAANRTFQQFEGRLSALHPLQEKIATEAEAAFRDISADELTAFCAAAPDLQELTFFFEECRRNARLRLPRNEELLAADLGVDGIHAWGRLYDRLSGKLRIPVMERGEIIQKSPGQVLFDSPERSVRENLFFAAGKAWDSIGETCADALNHIAGTRLTLYRHLNVDDHLTVPLRRNRMSRGTLESMWSAISERKGMLVRYLEAKARLLGLSQLAWYDIQAPLPQATAPGGPALSWDNACQTVISSFHEFSPELGAFAETTLREGWVESENRSGKRQGGFCTTFPGASESRIFMTFTGSPDSMSTLAHELGHAWHSWVLKEQPLFLQDYPMNLAETASTFAEAVVNNRRLAAAKSSRERLGMLDQMLTDSVSFLMNIHSRFLFEDRFHRERAAGEPGPERLSALMLEAQQEAYAGALDPAGWYPGFWISKLHFYISSLPFYNFPYTFGYLLSLGAAAIGREQGDRFPEMFRQLLIATGNRQAEDAVRDTLGCDLESTDFWNRSLDLIEQRVEEFTELAAELD
ncbi:MAG: M3 family oligoendopeptidase [Planctomycetaceae bacterium]|nr:M3 family oligoendopeptidase [Planctomycetaceae bacterium]